MEYFAAYPSPIGEFLLSSDGRNITGLSTDLYAVFPEGLPTGAPLRLFDSAKKCLDRYFAGEKISPFELPLHFPPAGIFRRTVWNMLCEIPYGELTTYGEIARRVARRMGMEKMSAQAVGGAVGSNPIAIFVPCHRVVGANGDLVGYAGGIEKKEFLLSLEGVDVEKFFRPSRKKTTKREKHSKQNLG